MPPIGEARPVLVDAVEEAQQPVDAGDEEDRELEDPEEEKEEPEQAAAQPSCCGFSRFS
jgi:hypothetical protein